MKFTHSRQINLAVAGVDQNPNIVPPAAADKWVISDRKYSQPDSQLNTLIVAVEFPNDTDTGTLEVFLYDDAADDWVAANPPLVNAKHLQCYKMPLPPGTYFVALTACSAATGTVEIRSIAWNGYEQEQLINHLQVDATGRLLTDAFIHQQNGIVTATGSAAINLAQAITGKNIKINWIGLSLSAVDTTADALVFSLTDDSDNIVAELWRFKPSNAPDGETAFAKHFPNGILLPDGYKIKATWANADGLTYRLTVAYETPDKI